MAGWRKEEESAAITRQRKRETFQGSAAWTVSSAFEVTMAAPVRDAEDPF